ncbi:MAG: response regulator [Deltaproteobacteria bacterium]|nr:response regulator [Deltaproteobacteria bacterium]
MHRLLIVDDEGIMTEELDALLTNMGYGVVGKAFSGEEAIAMARRLLPDLIIMDIVMPGAVDGIDAARTIKEELSIPVIFMTGYSDEALVEKAKVLNPYGYVIKPFNDTQIRSAIELGLYKKKADEALKKTYEELRSEVKERQKVIEELKVSQDNLRRLSSRTLETQEQERKRISMELHDQLGQNLSLLHVRIGTLRRNMPESRNDLKSECQELSQFVKQILEDTRRMSRELSPRLVEDLGLSAALRWLVEEAGKHLNIQTDINIEDIDFLLPGVTRVWVYRIFQEAISNITKHADASGITVIAKKDGDVVSFNIKDSGKGFDLEKITGLDATEKGLGLATMEERVKMMGGRFSLFSKKGEGTDVGFSLPIHEEREVTNGKLQTHTGG